MSIRLSIITTSALLWSSFLALSAEETIRFNRDVRPILSENCYHCHGPDSDARTADLRLDTEDGAKEYAIVPGESEASELVARIISDDPDSKMPPPDSERSLTQDQIDILRKWIDQGASYEKHWSFIPPKRPTLPSGVDGESPIDRFVRDALRSRNWSLSSEADRTTIIRRVSFDLIGLPPTLEEIDQFLEDRSPDAYEKLLDRLLAREEFGERMASDWLDAARYSDTYGYQVDRDRFVWPWRDWVINAFNQNMPYDQFVTQQLAGDLLPDAGENEILATTFNRLHPQKVEGGSVPEEFRVEYVADRTQTVATALMGLTMECCRCHNHKYDPLSQKEYYALSAFFDKIDEAGLYSYFTPAVPTPTMPLPDEGQKKQLEKLAADLTSAEQRLAMAKKDRSDAAAKWVIDRDPAPGEDFYAAPIASLDFENEAKAPNRSVQGVVGKAIELTGDDVVGTDVGNFRRFDRFSVALWIKTPNHKDRAVIFHRSRAWTDAASRGYQLLIEDGKLSWSLIHFWPGNAIRVRTVQPVPIDSWTHVTVSNDGSSRASGLRIYVDGKLAETEIVRDRLTKNITGGGGDNIAIGERFRDRGFKGGQVDQFRVFDCCLTPLEVTRLADRSDKNASDLIQLDALSTDQSDLLAEHHLLRHDATVKASLGELHQARKQLFELRDSLKEIMVMREMDSPRQSFLLRRGAYDARGETVEPGTPAVLTAFPKDQQHNRLGLSRWLTDPAHPLTARVAVNRLWQLCFGHGLVRTPEDFGSQGAPPTHPELLDWLAVEFVDRGWDTKAMLKQIMMSATYRQSSLPNDPSVAITDPDNLLMARFPSYRLPAEMLRDNSLAVSGRLVPTIGGPPVKPYEIEASFKPAKRDKGAGLYRRSLYTYWKRTGPAPAMMALDASKRDVCRVQRERTSSPIQAFVLLNGPQYVEAARGLAEDLTRQHGSSSETIDATLRDAFRILTSRAPDAPEMAVLTELYQDQLEYFRADGKRTEAYLAVGDAAFDDQLDATHVAATAVVIGTVMNFDHSVMKR